MKIWFENQVKSAAKQSFFAVKPRVVHSTTELLFATIRYYTVLKVKTKSELNSERRDFVF